VPTRERWVAAQDNKKKEEPNVAVHYTLAAIGAIIIMVLVCMPARRD
jgi:hypothetical protein